MGFWDNRDERPPDGNDPFKVTVDSVKRVLPKVYIVIIDGDECMLPKSQVTTADESELEQDQQNIDITIPKWLARDRNLTE